ncbi:MAG TPA: hypothetical protein VJ804_01520 [Acidimicrobiales bacterium]|nr:hypothetical protein [Acidimicrobiales bacterium]
MGDLYEDPHPGDGLLNLVFAGTGALVGTGLAGAVVPDTFAIVHAILSGLLFVVGTGAMLWGYALGVSRSRTLVVTLPGLFFLSGGAAPPDTRRRFQIALAVQVVAVVVAALIRPDTEVTFGVLAPVFGLGLMAMWGGRFGSFPARADVASTPEP